MLKNLLPMQAWIRRCWLFTHRVPVERVAHLVPAPLEPVTRDGQAFFNTVVARMEDMRPQGWPASLGLDYWHVGYRLYVRARTAEGPREGLLFLRSDCDRRPLAWAGNLLTDFRFHAGQVRATDLGPRTRLEVTAPGASAQAEVGARIAALPEDSAFGSLAEAEAFLKYRPCGLSPAGRNRVNAVPIARDEAAWRAVPVEVPVQRWEFLEAFDARPELAFELAPIEYRFGRGRILEGA